MAHDCLANDCESRISEKLAFCTKHWRLVPKEMKDQWKFLANASALNVVTLKKPEVSHKTFVKFAMQVIKVIDEAEMDAEMDQKACGL